MVRARGMPYTIIRANSLNHNAAVSNVCLLCTQVRASGVPYTIIRAYSLNNNAASIQASKEDTATAVLQLKGDPASVGGVISRYILIPKL